MRQAIMTHSRTLLEKKARCSGVCRRMWQSVFGKALYIGYGSSDPTVGCGRCSSGIG
jgi:hypothetical protein